MATGVVSLAGKDILTLNGRTITDYADGSVTELEFSNTLVETKVGKNGNILYAFNVTGKSGVLTLRLVRGSKDDKHLNGNVNQYILDAANYILLEGEFIKRAGDGTGRSANDTYILRGGVISNIPNAEDNVEGNTDQSVAVYTIQFPNIERVIT